MTTYEKACSYAVNAILLVIIAMSFERFMSEVTAERDAPYIDGIYVGEESGNIVETFPTPVTDFILHALNLAQFGQYDLILATHEGSVIRGAENMRYEDGFKGFCDRGDGLEVSNIVLQANKYHPRVSFFTCEARNPIPAPNGDRR